MRRAVGGFLRYVQLDTASDPASATVPSTARQLVLLDLLVQELKALGLADAARDEFGIVMATLPPTTQRKDTPVIGFLAHVDTSPELSGAGVKPCSDMKVIEPSVPVRWKKYRRRDVGTGRTPVQ